MPLTLLGDAAVRAGLWQAWLDSEPGESGGHEEGSFVLREGDATLRIARWLSGSHKEIRMPVYTGCRYEGRDIVATFHTHPNTGPDFFPEPSDTDIVAVRDDPNLKGELYLGEYVIARDSLYFIRRDGTFRVLGNTHELIAPSSERTE